MPFSNLLDDIGGQEPHCSQQFLLCQLRQPSSGDATAQLFGVARRSVPRIPANNNITSFAILSRNY